MTKRLSPALLLACCALLLFSCKKKDDPAPPPVNTNPYYFNFKLGAQSYNFNSNMPQYISSDDRFIGGYQMAATGFWPSIGLELGFDHPVTHNEVLSLAGQTIRFDNTTIRPELQWVENTNGDAWYSVDTANTLYSVHIASVKYVKVDTSIFNIVDVYEIKGTCTGVLENDDNPTQKAVLADGNFNFLISRVKN